MKMHAAIKSFIRTFVLHYFLIYGLTMLMTLLFCLVFNREATFGLDYFWQAALFALAADVPLAVYISPDELTDKQYWIRTIIHAVLLEAGIIPIGYVIGMWGGVGGFFAFFFAVLIVDVVMHFLSYLNNKVVTDRINKAIRARREKPLGGEENCECGETDITEDLNGND